MARRAKLLKLLIGTYTRETPPDKHTLRSWKTRRMRRDFHHPSRRGERIDSHADGWTSAENRISAKKCATHVITSVHGERCTHACMHARTLLHVHFRARSMKVIAPSEIVLRLRKRLLARRCNKNMIGRVYEYFCANEVRMRYVSGNKLAWSDATGSANTHLGGLSCVRNPD